MLIFVHTSMLQEEERVFFLAVLAATATCMWISSELGSPFRVASV